MISQTELKHLFHYDREGYLIRRFTTGNLSQVGMIAGSVNKHGYRYIVRKGKKYLAHRLIFMYHHGYVPEVLDHINGDRDDSRIENLRPCSRSQNNFNESLRPNNTSGVKGVNWCNSDKKWIARIQLNNKVIYLGRFDSLEKAKAKVVEARAQHHGRFANHG